MNESDNGPEFIALAVQEWIERRLARPAASPAPHRRAYSLPPPRRIQDPLHRPWQPVGERLQRKFNSRFRDEFLNRESFASVLEAKVLDKHYRQDTTTTARTLRWTTRRRWNSRSAAARLRPSPPTTSPHHHQPTTRKPHQTLIASGSNFGGRPTKGMPANLIPTYTA